jgi:hypothetical protein
MKDFQTFSNTVLWTTILIRENHKKNNTNPYVNFCALKKSWFVI